MLVKLRDRQRLASLTAGCGLLIPSCRELLTAFLFPSPIHRWFLRVLRHAQRENSFISHFPLFRMDTLDYQAKCLNMVLDSLRPRNSRLLDEGPKSDCCIAPLDRVGDELYACSACGRLCSDGGSDWS